MYLTVERGNLRSAWQDFIVDGRIVDAAAGHCCNLGDSNVKARDIKSLYTIQVCPVYRGIPG